MIRSKKRRQSIEGLAASAKSKEIVIENNQEKNVETVADIAIRAIENLLEFLRDSGLDKIARNFDFLNDGVETVEKLVSGNPEDRNWAALRLTAITKSPKNLSRPKIVSVRLRNAAAAAQMSPAEYIETILIPAGIILATKEMNRPQKIRLGKTWIKGEDEKIKNVRPRDLTVAEFIRWIYQRGHQSILESLLDTTNLKDPLITTTTVTGNAAEAAIDQAAIKKSGGRRKGPVAAPVITADDDPIQGAHISMGLIETRDDEMKKHLSSLLTKATPKERKLIRSALVNEGELLTLLLERGYNNAAIRQIRKRLRDRLKQSN